MGQEEGRQPEGLAASELRILLDGHWYGAVTALLDGQLGRLLTPEQLERARALTTAAQRVLELDAEDFASIAHGFDEPWTARLTEASFPKDPQQRDRGALASLIPLYELMLEVLEIRARRREPLGVVVSAHLIGEYLMQLAWESTLGHAGDPMQLPAFVGGSRWGTDDPTCAHPQGLRATVGSWRTCHFSRPRVIYLSFFLGSCHLCRVAGLTRLARSALALPAGTAFGKVDERSAEGTMRRQAAQGSAS